MWSCHPEAEVRIAIDIQATVGQKSGIGHYADGLIRHLDQHRHTYFFLKPTFRHSRESGNPERDLNTLQRIYWESLKFPYEAKKMKADIIHTIGFSAPLIRSCKVVSTVHDLIGFIYSDHLGPWSKFYWKRWLPNSFRKADHLIASSKNTKNDILKFLRYPEDRISVIPLAVDRRFQKIDRESAHRRLRNYFMFDQFILNVGTVEPRKNLKNVISAYALLSKELRKAYPLMIVGKIGWGVEELKQRIRGADIEEDVHFIDYVSDEELVFFYNGATLFVYPSLYEGFGLPVLEAMSCGTPVISSNLSSIPEVTGDAAVLVDPLKPQEIADAMELLLLHSSLRESLSLKGLERSTLFSWEKVAKQTTEVYERLA